MSDKDVTVFTYTNEQAIADGIKIRMGERVFCTTNLWNRLLESVPDDFEEDEHPLWVMAKLNVLVKKFNAGTYYDPGATKYPEECNCGLACYLVGKERVWAIEDGDGLHLILPSDY